MDKFPKYIEEIDFSSPISAVKDSQFFQINLNKDTKTAELKWGYFDQYHDVIPETEDKQVSQNYGNIDELVNELKAFLRDRGDENFTILPISIEDYTSQFAGMNPKPKQQKLQSNVVLNEKSVEVTPILNNNLPLVIQTLKDLNIIHDVVGSKIDMVGPPDKLAQAFEYLYEMESAQSNMLFDDEYGYRDQQKGEFAQQTIQLGEVLPETEFEMYKKAEELQLVLDVDGEKATITGQEEGIIDFMIWMYEKHWNNNSQMMQAFKRKHMKDQVQQMIPLKPFHQNYESKVQKLASELEVFCEYTSDSILVIGGKDLISTFQVRLQELEADERKLLYPDNWEFLEMEKISEKMLSEISDEYNKLAIQFYSTMNQNSFEILSITKIQNRSLVEQYVNKVKVIQDERGQKALNSRELLFFGYPSKVNNNQPILQPVNYAYKKKKPAPAPVFGRYGGQGSRTDISPDYYFKESDVGLDVQFCNNPKGQYGKGLYFYDNVQVIWNNSQCFADQNSGEYGVIVADVCAGNCFQAHNPQQYIKPPQGYDSVGFKEGSGKGVVIYTSFQSCPYYYIKFKQGF